MVKLISTADGSSSVYSAEYGSAYHSRFGAMQESRHVFIAHGLHHLTEKHKKLRILEMGFGTGLNAWLTLLEAEKLGLQVHYVAIELHPLAGNLLNEFVLPGQNESTRDKFKAIHESVWESTVIINHNFALQKIQCNFEEYQPTEQFDLIYYDAFGPETQPNLWEAPMMVKMAESLVPAGVLVTFCAKGSFKRALKSAGLMVERLPGPPGKREMTRAFKP